MKIEKNRQFEKVISPFTFDIYIEGKDKIENLKLHFNRLTYKK